MSKSQRYDVGSVEEFEDGTIQVREAGGQSFGVVRRGDDLYAVRNVCPHQLAEIARGTLGGTMLASQRDEWIPALQGLVIRCPRHGWEFDVRTGETVCGTDRRRLGTYPVTVEDGRVYVTVRRRPFAAAEA